MDAAGEPVPEGEVGEITLRLPAGERRYWNDAEATARTWRRGWVHTGDLGRVDDDGFLYVVDRAKDVIIRGGYNVASAEVEGAIYELAEVAESAVVGVPHGILGQDVATVIRLRDGAPPLTLDDLRSHLVDRLADYKRHGCSSWSTSHCRATPRASSTKPRSPVAPPAASPERTI